MRERMVSTIAKDIASYYDVEVREGYLLLRCKVCGKSRAVGGSDQAGFVRAVGHGVSHGGVQADLTPVSRK